MQGEDGHDDQKLIAEFERFRRTLPNSTDALLVMADQGMPVGIDPEEAEDVGAFVEDAISEEDALESMVDLGMADLGDVSEE